MVSNSGSTLDRPESPQTAESGEGAECDGDDSVEFARDSQVRGTVKLEITRVGTGFTLTRSRELNTAAKTVLVLEMDVAESITSVMPKIAKMLKRML